MLFWIALFLAIVCFLIYYFFDCNVAFAGVFFFGIAVTIMAFLLAITYIGLPGKVEANHQRYQSLVYQAEHKLYDNDNDIGKKELANQIQEWNEDLATGKALQNDFWVGLFYPDVYDQFDFIPIDIMEG